jgi:hypothetical protein
MANGRKDMAGYYLLISDAIGGLDEKTLVQGKFVTPFRKLTACRC